MALTYTRPDWRAGQYPKGGELETVLDQIDYLTAPGWTDYTPSWLGSVTNPVIGNGTLAGRYRVSPSGDIVYFVIRILMGGTTTYGSGFWTVSLPTDPAASATSQLELVVTAMGVDSSLGNRYNLAGNVFAGPLVFNTTASNLLTSTNPFTWASSDYLIANGWYEPA